MKISIEFKNGGYTVTYGSLKAAGKSVKEALDALIEKFRVEMDKFFVK